MLKANIKKDDSEIKEKETKPKEQKIKKETKNKIKKETKPKERKIKKETEKKMKDETRITEQPETNIKIKSKEETSENKKDKKKKEENIGIIDFISNKEIAIAGFIFLILIVIFIIFMIGASNPQNIDLDTNEILEAQEIQKTSVSNETVSENIQTVEKDIKIEPLENSHVRIVKGSGLE